jgi:hypothetical protein
MLVGNKVDLEKTREIDFKTAKVVPSSCLARALASSLPIETSLSPHAGARRTTLTRTTSLTWRCARCPADARCVERARSRAWQTSAKTGHNVEQAFTTVATAALRAKCVRSLRVPSVLCSRERRCGAARRAGSQRRSA